MNLAPLETACPVLDERRLSSNVARMNAHLGAPGVGLRHHVKTAKSIEVARRVIGAQHAEYRVVSGGDDVIAIWARIHGW